MTTPGYTPNRKECLHPTKSTYKDVVYSYTAIPHNENEQITATHTDESHRQC